MTDPRTERVARAPARCEPPTNTPTRDGWHYIKARTNGAVVIVRFIEEDDDGGFWWHHRSPIDPNIAWNSGWRYLHPVSRYDPANVAALVAAALAIANAAHPTDRPDPANRMLNVKALFIEDLAAALEPFKEP